MHQNMDNLFGKCVFFPDTDYMERFNNLIGLDEHKHRLINTISLIVHPAKLEIWAKKYHPKATDILKYVQRRPPLVVLEGDVGSGKSEIAETIGDAIARQNDISVTLFPLSLSTRGQGRVGEMTQLLSSAFDNIIDEAKKYQSHGNSSRGAIIFLVDEADALAQSREFAQMHHEDRAGVNAFIRGVDHVNHSRLPICIIMCTNRLGALDPAIKRRAAEILTFNRPTDKQRYAVLKVPLTKLGFSEQQISKMVVLTGKSNGKEYGYTFSDLTQRLIPRIIIDAFPEKAIDPIRALRIVETIVPTPPFQENTI